MGRLSRKLATFTVLYLWVLRGIKGEALIMPRISTIDFEFNPRFLSRTMVVPQHSPAAKFSLPALSSTRYSGTAAAHRSDSVATTASVSGSSPQCNFVGTATAAAAAASKKFPSVVELESAAAALEGEGS